MKSLPTTSGALPRTRASLAVAFSSLIPFLLGSCDSPTTGLAATPGQVRLTVTPTVLLLDDGAEGSFEAQLTDALGASVRSRQLVWTSLSPGVASVSSSGHVEAKHPGEAQIRVAAPSHELETEVVVIVRPVADDVLFIVRDEVHTGRVGAALNDSVEVRVIDKGGLPVPGVPVAFEVETGEGAVSPLVAVTGPNGYAKAEWTLGTRVGANALLVMDDGAAGAAAAGAPPETRRGRSKIHAWGGAGHPHRVTVTPGSDTLGVNDANRLTAVVEDKWGNPIADALVEWATSNEPVASVDGFGNVVGRQEGQATITATVASGDGSASAGYAPPKSNVSGAASIAVRKLGSTSIVRAGGNGQTGPVGERLPQPLVVRVQNDNGDGVPGFEVSWSVSGGGGALSASRSVTDGAGNARIDWTLGTRPGPQSVTAWSGGTNAAVFSATAEVGPAGQITVTPASIAMDPGDTQQLDAVVLDGYGNQITDRLVTWHSDDGSVASVDVGGFVTAVGGGETAVTATLDDAVGRSDVAVSGSASDGGPAEWSISVNPPSSTLNSLGATLDLVATVTDGNGAYVAGADVVWNALTPELVSVDGFGRIMSHGVGVAMITAATTAGAADTAVVVARQVVASVGMNPAEMTLQSGVKSLLVASAHDSLGNVVQDASYDWTTTESPIAGLDQAGGNDRRYVVARAAGSATIVVESGGITGWTPVTVSPTPVASLTVSPDPMSLAVGATAQATAQATDADGNPVERSDIAWSTSNASVATVSSAGVVTGVAQGTAQIEASVDGKSDALTVTVSGSAPPPPPPPGGAVRAFPGAQGYGAASVGGRGGTVYIVDRRDDNVSNPKPGMLRHALLQTEPRTIVFAVAGEINLIEEVILWPSHSNLTVAGQTAPGSGVTIRGSHIQVRGASNLVFRYLRMRTDGGSNFIIVGGHDIILDHVSAQFASNDNVETFLNYATNGAERIYNLTLSRSIIGPGLGAHATAGGWRGRHYWENGQLHEDHRDIYDVDYHHNLWVNNSSRTPRTIARSAKVVNNVVYNYVSRAMESRGSTSIDYIGNYIKPGPMTGGGGIAFRHDVRDPNTDQAYPDGSIYVAGNHAAPTFDASADNWAMVKNRHDKKVVDSRLRRHSALPDARFKIGVQSADAAYASVMSDVGANARLTCDGQWVGNMDSLDAGQIDTVSRDSGPSAPYASRAQAGGDPGVQQGSPCTDQDADGMPDAFENRFDLNPGNASDAREDRDGDGYTNLEEYLNGRQP